MGTFIVCGAEARYIVARVILCDDILLAGTPTVDFKADGLKRLSNIERFYERRDLEDAAERARARTDELASLRARADGAVRFGMHGRLANFRSGGRLSTGAAGVRPARSCPPPKFSTYQGDF